MNFGITQARKIKEMTGYKGYRWVSDYINSDRAFKQDWLAKC